MKARAAPASPPDQDKARQKCLRLLTTRPRSRAELRQALHRNGFGQTIISRVLAGLEQAGLINDQEFARAWVASRRASGDGPRKLHWELRRKGVAEPLIQRAIDDSADPEAEVQQALALASRRLRGELTAKELARLQRFLLGRGFHFRTVDTVLQHLSGGISSQCVT